jgi:hypothetical protein
MAGDRGGVGVACFEDCHNECDGGHDPADEGGGPHCHLQRAYHREDTELYLKHCILRWVFVRQSDAVPTQVARADANDVQGNDQLPCRVCEVQSAMTHLTDPTIPLPCPLRHNHHSTAPPSLKRYDSR